MSTLHEVSRIIRAGGWHRVSGLAAATGRSSSSVLRVLDVLLEGGVVQRHGHTCGSAWALAGETSPPAPAPWRHIAARRAELRAWLVARRRGAAISQCADYFGVSRSTARRDLRALGATRAGSGAETTWRMP